jgi:hypothetical protein
MLTEPTEDVNEPSSIQTVIHTRDNNGGITVYVVSGRTKRETQTSIVGPSRVHQMTDNWTGITSATYITLSRPTHHWPKGRRFRPSCPCSDVHLKNLILKYVSVLLWNPFIYKYWYAMNLLCRHQTSLSRLVRCNLWIFSVDTRLVYHDTRCYMI